MGVALHSFPNAGADLEVDRRAAPRLTSLIRAAKLVCGQGEFVCVVRDVSAFGVGLRCFHTIPDDPAMALELQNGEAFEIEKVRGGGLEASYRFRDEGVEVQRLVRETWSFPRRPLRLTMVLPMTLRTPAGPIATVTRNISRQGCRIETATPLALAQSVILESPYLPGIRAKVRWRRDGQCGLVFDDTFSLREFAVHAARLQCPALVKG